MFLLLLAIALFVSSQGCPYGYYGSSCQILHPNHVECDPVEIPNSQSILGDADLSYSQGSENVIISYSAIYYNDLYVAIGAEDVDDSCTYRSDRNPNEYWVHYTMVENGECVVKVEAEIPVEEFKDCTAVEITHYDLQAEYIGYWLPLTFFARTWRTAILGMTQEVTDSISQKLLILVQTSVLANCQVQMKDPIEWAYTGVVSSDTNDDMSIHKVVTQIIFPEGEFFDKYSFEFSRIDSPLLPFSSAQIGSKEVFSTTIGSVIVHSFDLNVATTCDGFDTTEFSVVLNVYHDGIFKQEKTIVVTVAQDDQCEKKYEFPITMTQNCPSDYLFEIGEEFSTSISLSQDFGNFEDIVMKDFWIAEFNSQDRIGDYLVNDEITTTFGDLMEYTGLDLDIQGNHADITFGFTFSVDSTIYNDIFIDSSEGYLLVKAYLEISYENLERRRVLVESKLGGRRDASYPHETSCGALLSKETVVSNEDVSELENWTVGIIVGSVLVGIGLIVCLAIAIGMCCVGFYAFCPSGKQSEKKEEVVKENEKTKENSSTQEEKR